MRHSPSHDIAIFLSENGFGELGYDLFADTEAPNKPNSIIAVEVYGTYAPASASMSYKQPTVQVLARDALGNGTACSDKIYAIDELLHGLEGLVVGDTRYAFILNTNDPVRLRGDKNKRPVWVVNYRCLLGEN